MKIKTVEIEQLIKDKKAIIDLKKVICQNTYDVFACIKNSFKELLDQESEDISLNEENDHNIIFKVYNTTIGCAIVDGVSMLNDSKLISEEMIEQINAKNLREIVYDTDYNKFLTGMIAVYVKEEGSKNVTASKFYVNHNKTTMYKSEIGLTTIHHVEADRLEEMLPAIIHSNIENALFQGFSQWDDSSQAFKDPSELKKSKKIGF
ncbi:hypothetical protein [Bacillus taeanensis]|uniref:Uncharacterized protein n=1 Tax=Bacillus taeanensis TaxID=273032 RepID=A0A366XWY9_9BACI|nr:hypothetical protein [Bacillus taeanensis]RBW70156.1 hypothetical protein DS031_08180 [Bacillus taeanensis]